MKDFAINEGFMLKVRDEQMGILVSLVIFFGYRNGLKYSIERVSLGSRGRQFSFKF